MPVQTERADYAAIAPQWARCRDVYEGRDAVLKAGVKYVPALPGSDTGANQAYRERGTFYGATQRTIQGLVGAIFQKPPEVEFPEALADYLDDITLAGVAFEQFAADAGREIMLLGRYGVLIDLPADDAAGATEKRPYLIGYKAEDIINWRTARLGGDDVLIFVVLRESVDTPDVEDPFVLKVLTQYRVITLANGAVTQQLWREQEGGSKEFVVFGPPITLMRRGAPLPFIPFVFFAAAHATPDLERPPLLDLADVNLGHWRNSVDHEYGLHLVALPTPYVCGPKGTTDGPMKIGPSVVWELEVNGKAGMLEFTGAGLQAIADAMELKRLQMASLGARLLEEPARGDTATAVLIRHSGESASLRTVAGSIEQGFTQVLQIVAWWVGLEDQPSDTAVNVELNKEYLDIRATAQEIQVALTALQAGEISFATWWSIVQKGGWGREGIDAAAERLEIARQAAAGPAPITPDFETEPEIVPPALPKPVVVPVKPLPPAPNTGGAF
jgi:hypothetical protein